MTVSKPRHGGGESNPIACTGVLTNHELWVWTHHNHACIQGSKSCLNMRQVVQK